MDVEFDPSEIERELLGARLSAPARASYFARDVPAVRWRDVLVVAASQPLEPAGCATGRALVSRRPAVRQRRYERLIAEERQPAHRIDYKLQICCAGAVLEEEIGDLLAEPLRPAAPLLAAAARAHGGKGAEKTAGFLDRWGTGQEPTTLGLVTMGLLVAVRRGSDRDAAALAPVLDRAFRPDLVAALRANALGRVLDQLRITRNDACHPNREFDEAAYREFAVRLVGNERLTAWEETGPATAPLPPDAGFLHQLLAGSKLVPEVGLPPAGAALDRLSELAAPRAGAFELELVPFAPTAAHRFRDVSVEAVRAEPSFRLGGELVLRLRAGRACHLALIDLGTSGAVSLLLPNALCPRPVLSGGVSAYFPGPGFADFRFTLQGGPGRERLIALATADPLPALPAPGRGQTFAPLTAADADFITAAVRALPDAGWSAAACEFTIEE